MTDSEDGEAYPTCVDENHLAISEPESESPTDNFVPETYLRR